MKEINKDEYYDYIVCPLCNKFVQRMKPHLSKSHNMSWEIFHTEYPDIPNISGKQLLQRQEIMIKNNNTKEFRDKVDFANHNPSAKKLESSINNFKKYNASEKRLEQNKLASIRMSEYNKSEKHRNTVRELMLKRHENPEYTNSLARYGRIGNRVRLTLPNGREITTRSSVEAEIITELSKFTKNFDYESISVKYEYDGRLHNYLPDIIIDNKLMLEDIREEESTEINNVLKDIISGGNN